MRLNAREYAPTHAWQPPVRPLVRVRVRVRVCARARACECVGTRGAPIPAETTSNSFCANVPVAGAGASFPSLGGAICDPKYENEILIQKTRPRYQETTDRPRPAAPAVVDHGGVRVATPVADWGVAVAQPSWRPFCRRRAPGGRGGAGASGWRRQRHHVGRRRRRPGQGGGSCRAA